jgi:hypothetical protein
VAYVTIIRFTLAEAIARTAFQRKAKWEVRQPCKPTSIESYLDEIKNAVDKQGHNLVRTWIGNREAMRCTLCSKERIRKDMKFWMQNACEKGKLSTTTAATEISAASSRGKEVVTGAGKLEAHSRGYFITNEHHVIRVGATRKCRLCQMEGHMQWFTSNPCSRRASDDGNHIDNTMEGTMMQANQANKEVRALSTANKDMNKKNAA